LQQLIEDSDAGLVDETMFSFKEENESQSKDINCKITLNSKNKNKSKNDLKIVKCKVKTTKSVILDPKWTNYSEQFLGQKFSTPVDIKLVQSEICPYEKQQVYFTNPSQIQLPSPPPSCSSPRDINEISLHISLIDNNATSLVLEGDDIYYDEFNAQEDFYSVITEHEENIFSLIQGQEDISEGNAYS